MQDIEFPQLGSLLNLRNDVNFSTFHEIYFFIQKFVLQGLATVESYE